MYRVVGTKPAGNGMCATRGDYDDLDDALGVVKDLVEQHYLVDIMERPDAEAQNTIRYYTRDKRSGVD